MDIGTLKGIGPKTEKIFKNNGIMTINDLISYYPFRYDVIKRSNIDELIQDDKIIGAVTRVLVDDVDKGYGISIITMLEEGDSLR